MKPPFEFDKHGIGGSGPVNHIVSEEYQSIANAEAIASAIAAIISGGTALPI